MEYKDKTDEVFCLWRKGEISTKIAGMMLENLTSSAFIDASQIRGSKIEIPIVGKGCSEFEKHR